MAHSAGRELVQGFTRTLFSTFNLLVPASVAEFKWLFVSAKNAQKTQQIHEEDVYRHEERIRCNDVIRFATQHDPARLPKDESRCHKDHEARNQGVKR